MRLILVATAVTCCTLATGCGVPQDVARQAEHVASIAAEGSLLARDVRQGESTATFAHVHAEALREKLAPLEDAVEDAELGRVVRAVDRALEALERESGNALRAQMIERRLGEAAKRADEIAKAAG